MVLCYIIKNTKLTTICLYQLNIYNQTKYFFMEIINTFKQSIAKIFDGTTV